ncbi:MAG: hypothetical protein ACM3SY_15295 [Candidatus Omnitrophota bacterium]
MAINNPQILLTGFAFLFSAIGFFINTFLSRKRIRSLNRCIEVCEKFVYKEFNNRIKSVLDHYKNEMNRILEISIREILTNDNRLSYGIQTFEIKDLNPNYIEVFKKVRQTYVFIKKLESAVRRLNLFQWLFLIILAVILFLTFLVIVLTNLVYGGIAIIIFFISILSFILFLIDAIRANDLIAKTEKEYGISIGE